MPHSSRKKSTCQSSESVELSLGSTFLVGPSGEWNTRETLNEVQNFSSILKNRPSCLESSRPLTVLETWPKGQFRLPREWEGKEKSEGKHNAFHFPGSLVFPRQPLGSAYSFLSLIDGDSSMGANPYSASVFRGQQVKSAHTPCV